MVTYQLWHFGDGHTDLGGSVALAHSHLLVGGRGVVHSDGERNTDLISSRVALANGCLRLVDLWEQKVSGYHEPTRPTQATHDGRHAEVDEGPEHAVHEVTVDLGGQREHGALARRDGGCERQHAARLVVATA